MLPKGAGVEGIKVQAVPHSHPHPTASGSTDDLTWPTLPPSLQTYLSMLSHTCTQTPGPRLPLSHVPLFSVPCYCFPQKRHKNCCSRRKEPERCYVKEDAAPLLALGCEWSRALL